MANKNLGIIKMARRSKYKKYTPDVAIPEECPPCPDCEPCEECEECETCAEEGTYCEGDGFANCEACQQAWCECTTQLANVGCGNIPLAEPEENMTVLQTGIEILNINLNSGVQTFFKILPVFFVDTIDFLITMVSPLDQAGIVRIRMRYGAYPTTVYDFQDTFPDTPGAVTHYAFDNVDDQVVYISLLRVGTNSIVNLLPTLIGDSPFTTCMECSLAYKDSLCGIPDVPLAEPETFNGKTVWVLEDGVSLGKTVNPTTTDVYFKIHVADYTDNVNFKVQIYSPTGYGYYYIKAGEPATSSNYDLAAFIEYGIVYVDVPTSIEQDIYITLRRTGTYSWDYSAAITATLTNHSPYTTCGDAIDALNECLDNLTTTEDSLSECIAYTTDLETNLTECYEDLLDAGTEEDFVLFWSGGIHQATDIGGNPCITIEPWTSLWGDAIFQNPNLCEPTAECQLFGNMCYCYTLNNLNPNCDGFNAPSACGTTNKTCQWLYIGITSKFNFYSHVISFTKVEVSNAPGDVFIFDCTVEEPPTPPEEQYFKVWVYRMNQDVWSMVTLLDAVITFTAVIEFTDAVPPRTIEHKTILRINQ